MLSTMAARPRIPLQRAIELAERIEADIRARQLKPGDRFLSTAETAKWLRVDTGAANQALQMLVKRGVVRRCQRVGTFIDEGLKRGGPGRLEAVHLLVNDRYPTTEGWLDTGTVLGLQSALPGVRIQFHLIPEGDEDDCLQRIFHDVLRNPGAEGFILIRSSLTTQRLVEAGGFPAVVFGHPYASVRTLPYVDRDQWEMGRLMADHVLRHGHQRVVILTRPRILPGDQRLIDGVIATAQRAGLSAGAVTVRCPPEDDDEIRAEVRTILDSADSRPGFVVRPAVMADAAVDVMRTMGLKPQEDIALATGDCFRDDWRQLPYPVIRPAYSRDEQGERLGRLIAELAGGEKPQPRGRLTPVTLGAPDNAPAQQRTSQTETRQSHDLPRTSSVSA
jgi:DNA-binding LacI/PurR family transcriptional regulator